MTPILNSALLSLMEQAGIAIATLLWMRVYQQSQPELFRMVP